MRVVCVCVEWWVGGTFCLLSSSEVSSDYLFLWRGTGCCRYGNNPLPPAMGQPQTRPSVFICFTHAESQ